MFVHVVLFWLKPGLTAEEVRRFESSLATLVEVSSVIHGWVGAPAATDRPVVDRTYSYGLTVTFRDLAGHDAYQVDPTHRAFVDQFSHLWDRVKIYDFDPWKTL